MKRRLPVKLATAPLKGAAFTRASASFKERFCPFMIETVLEIGVAAVSKAANEAPAERPVAGAARSLFGVESTGPILPLTTRVIFSEIRRTGGMKASPLVISTANTIRELWPVRGSFRIVERKARPLAAFPVSAALMARISNIFFKGLRILDLAADEAGALMS